MTFPLGFLCFHLTAFPSAGSGAPVLPPSPAGLRAESFRGLSLALVPLYLTRRMLRYRSVNAAWPESFVAPISSVVLESFLISDPLSPFGSLFASFFFSTSPSFFRPFWFAFLFQWWTLWSFLHFLVDLSLRSFLLFLGCPPF